MVLHREPHLTSSQHLPSWAFFAFTAGAVNAGALLACERFVSHVTGTVTRIGVDARGVLALDYAMVLFAFIVGAMTAILIVRRLTRPHLSTLSQPAQPAYWLPLTLVSVLLMFVACAGALGTLGPFGGSVETAHDFVLLAILSFTMGMQNAAVAASTGMAVRTTHMTGPVTDIAVALAILISGSSEERSGARRSLVLRGTKLIAFVVGAAVMAVLCPRVAWLSFLLPAAAGLVGTVRSFIPARDELLIGRH
jgi:uncharacterized membrane protein YoaK (UPF0700 family)